MGKIAQKHQKIGQKVPFWHKNKLITALKEYMKNIFRKIADSLFGDKYVCLCCKDERLFDDHNYLCDKCYNAIEFIKNACQKCGDQVGPFDSFCDNCKKKEYKHSFDRAYCATKYSGPAMSMVYSFKYGGNKYLCKVISKFMIDFFEDLKDKPSIDLVVPVPLGEKRLKRRGFNQAQMLAENIAKHFSFELNVAAVVRRKNTDTQTSMTRTQRLENVKGAFSVTDKQQISGKNILLIDDIVTTGATCDEISTILKKAGTKNVYVLAFCHA